MIDMTEGKPIRLISRFAFPMLLGNLLQQAYNIVDSVVVGNFVGKEALAAVGNSFIVMLLLVSVFTGIGIGASILIAQFFGSGQKEKLQSTVDTLYIAMVVGAAVITVSGIVCARPFLNLMNTPQGDTMEMSALYLKTMFAGTFVSFGYNINNAILQGVGDSKSSLLFLSIATVINIVLDLVFVTVFDMGIFGVALATLIAQCAAFLFGVWYINRTITLFRISLRHIKFDMSILSRCIRIGLPAGVQNALFSIGTVVLQRLVNGHGSAFMAGYSATNKIDTFVFMPLLSFANATSTYVGQNIGAKKLDRVKQGVRSTLFISIALSVSISILVMVFGRYLLMAFTHDEEVLHTGQEFIMRLMPGYFLLAVIFILGAAVRGAGKSLMPMVITFVSLIIVRVPSAYLFNYISGKYDIFWCYAAGWLAGALIITPYYLSGRWEKDAFRFVSEDHSSQNAKNAL